MKVLRRMLEAKYRTKLVRTYVLVALIPFVLLSLLGGVTMLQNGRRTVEEHTVQMVHQVQTSMDIYIGMVEKIADYINKSLCNSTVFQARTTEELEQADDAQATYDMLEKIASSYPEIVGILIATDNDLYVSDGMTRLSRDPFYKEKWYQQAQQNPEDVVIVSNAIGRNIIAIGDIIAAR